MQRTVIDDRYTLGKLLGSGGMAQVYLAHDEVLDRDVALKVLRGQYAEDEEFVGRFRREARSAAGLSHPNIVSVYDQGRSEDGAYYMAMEYVPGGTLKDRIRRDGALAPDAAAGVALQITDALRVAHEKGVIHRDIKPQNVLVTSSGDVKVTDFGIARAASATTATTTGTVLGTAGYMSPEQAKGEPVGPQSDLYSLGAVLYEMLTGNLLYEADSDIALAVRHINEPPPSPREANPEVSKVLDALTIKLLAKNPEDRYTSAGALADDLERVRSGLPLAVAGPGNAEVTTEVMTAPLPTRRSPEGRTRRTAVQPPITAPAGAPGRGARRRGRLFPALAALLLAAALIGGLVLALTRGSEAPGTGGGKNRSGTENTAASSAQTSTTQSPSVSQTPPAQQQQQPVQPPPVQPPPVQPPPVQPPPVQPPPAPAQQQPVQPSATPAQPPQVAPAQPQITQPLHEGGDNKEKTKKKQREKRKK
jgi:serine/threonine protein kinase